MAHGEMPRWQRSVAALLGIQFTVFSLLTLAAGARPATAQEVEEDSASQEAQEAPATEAPVTEAPATEKSDEDPWERAHAFLVSAEYDKAEAVLQTAVLSETDTEVLGRLWLKLIETHVLRAKSFRSGEDAEIADHYYGKAKEAIRECLGNPELVHLRPDPNEAPDPMPAYFDDAVRQMFGALKIRELVPADAIVLLDGVPVPVPPGETLPRLGNVPVGQHTISAEANGYNTATEQVTIASSVTLSHPVNLKKKRGVIWYAGRGAVLAGATVAAILVGRGSDTPPAAEEPLPGPPGTP